MSLKGKRCTECDKKLAKNEIALSRKLIGDLENDLFCLTCMAEYIGCTEDDLEIKIAEFKEQGCALFL